MSYPVSYRGGANRSVPIYQIDFTAIASGKRIASSKRRVRWRFGFANLDALARGESGTACRGEEHDITLVWSITSGKRLVLSDGQEVHYSMNRGNEFEYSWTMRGQHVVKIVAHAAPPMAPQPGFRQYDLFINGQSFFILPKVFRLGMRSSTAATAPLVVDAHQHARGSSRRHGSSRSAKSADIGDIEAPHNPDEEEAYLQEAIRQSLKDDMEPEKKEAEIADLLDFGGDYQTILPATSNAFASSTPPADSWGPSAVPAGGVYDYSTQSAGTESIALPPSQPQSYSGYGGGNQELADNRAPPTGGPPSAGSNQFANPFAAPSPSSGYPSSFNVPSIDTQFQGMNLGDGTVPHAVTPQAQATPSSLGFGSPTPDFSGFSPGPTYAHAPQPPPQSGGPYNNASTVPSSDAGFSGSGVASKIGTGAPAPVHSEQPQPSSSAAPASFSELLNVNNFSLDMKKSAPTSAAIPASNLPTPAAQVNPFTGAVVVSPNQSTDYASQYGLPPLAQNGPPPMKVPPMSQAPTTSQQQTYQHQQPYQKQPPQMQQYPQSTGMPSTGQTTSQPPASQPPSLDRPTGSQAMHQQTNSTAQPTYSTAQPTYAQQGQQYPQYSQPSPYGYGQGQPPSQYGYPPQYPAAAAPTLQNPYGHIPYGQTSQGAPNQPGL